MAGFYALANGTAQQFFSTWQLEQIAIAGSFPGPVNPVGPGIFSLNGGSVLLAKGAAFAVNLQAAPNAVDFDESTNAALVADIIQNYALYSAPTVSGSAQLQKNGQAETIAAASELYSARATILAGVPEATLESFVAALWAGTATTAQTQKAVAFLAAKLRIAGII